MRKEYTLDCSQSKVFILYVYNVVVASRLRSAIRDVDASHWQKCLSSWMKLQRPRPHCTVDCSRSDDSFNLTSDNRSLDNHLNYTVADRSQNSADCSGSKSAMKRPSAHLVTFRVSAKCSGRTSAFSSQVLLIYCLLVTADSERWNSLCYVMAATLTS